MNLKEKEYLKITNRFKYFIFLSIYFLLYPLAKILYGRKRNWIICERGYDAQDNGYYFFKFLIEKHPEINSIFLIKRNSPDFKKVSNIGKTVQFGSFKHFFMAIGCPVKISSHLFGYAPWIQMSLYLRRNKTSDIHVFLQHGVIKNEHEGLHGCVCRSLKLFICGAKPEYEFVRDSFEYENDVPVYTGLARYDNLNEYQTKKQVLFMPTWRRELNGVSTGEFINSNFYKNWVALLNSNALKRFCLDNNVCVKFYLHASLQNYSSLFHGTDYLLIVNFGDEDVQSLLKESKVLVTDYSSVFFDFAYMNKPVIYYQFDEGDFYHNHYSKGYFDYRRDGFGDVCVDCDSTIKSLDEIAENDFKVDKKYLKRSISNFVFGDNKNSQRIFEKIINKIKL